MVAVTSVSAQEFSWGVKAGMNIASVGGDIDGTSVRIGYVAGLTGEYMFSSESSALSFELLYSSQGFKVDKTGYDLSYINIPILYNYYITERFAVKAGIQPGFLISAKMRYDGESADIKDGYNSFDLAIPVGLSYNLTEKLVVDARYNIGCANIWEDSGDSKARNNAFQLSLGVKF